MKFGETTPSIGGPSFPGKPPTYQHLMELRARGELREEDLDDLPDARFIEKYGADEYWQRTRAAREDGAVGYAGHAPNEAGVGGIAAAAERASTPRGDAPGPNPAPPPANDWSTRNPPRWRRLDRLGTKGDTRRIPRIFVEACEDCATRKSFIQRTCGPRGDGDGTLATDAESAMNVTATRMLARRRQARFRGASSPHSP